MTPLFGRGQTVRWPLWSAGGVSVNGAHLQKIDGAALLAAMFREQIVGWLNELIDQHGSGLTGTISRAQRTERLKQIETGMLRLDYAEQASLDRSISDGTPLMPQEGIGPRAVLMLAPNSPAPRPNP